MLFLDDDNFRGDVDAYFNNRMKKISSKPRLPSRIVTLGDSCSDDALISDAESSSACSNSDLVIDLDGVMDQVHHNEGLMRELILDYRDEIDAQLLKISEILLRLQKDKNTSEFGVFFDRLAMAAQCIKDASSDMLCAEMQAAAASMERHATKKDLKKCLVDYEALSQASTNLSVVLESVEI
jgi:hypothetical protein